MGTSYACFLGIVVLINISNMAKNTIEKGKRLAKLEKLKANQQIMIAEHTRKKMKQRDLRVKNRDKRIRMNQALKKVMKRPENNTIMPRLRVIRAIEDAKRERRQIESKYKTKRDLQKELKEALATHNDKSKIRAIKMKFKKNGLQTILEESNDDIQMENEDIDQLLKLNEKIKQLETERDEGQDVDPTNR